jgi:hypothetical protein
VCRASSPAVRDSVHVESTEQVPSLVCLPNTALRRRLTAAKMVDDLSISAELLMNVKSIGGEGDPALRRFPQGRSILSVENAPRVVVVFEVTERARVPPRPLFVTIR